jgi:hypothetical protein
LRAKDDGIIREIVPAIADQADCKRRFATPGGTDQQKAQAVPCDDSGCVEAIESPRSEQLEQAKRPEVALQELGLGRKGGGDEGGSLASHRPKVQERGPIGDVKIVLALKGREPICPE